LAFAIPKAARASFVAITIPHLFVQSENPAIDGCYWRKGEKGG